METPIAVTPAITPESSFEDVRNFFASEPAPVIIPEPKPETPEANADEPVVDPAPVGDEAIAADPDAAKITEPESEPGSTEQTDPEAVPVDDAEVEEPLPEGVVKRIAKEVERTSRIQREIDTAVSARKAAAAELQRLKAETSGSEPAPTPAPAKVESTEKARPVRPVLEGFDGDWDQFQAASKAFDVENEAWLIAETTKNVTREVNEQLTVREQERLARQTWDEAVVVHGATFPDLMDAVVAGSPAGFQEALSGLENWSGVAMHLGQNPEKLTALVSTFKANPFAAVAQLGRIEQQLESPATPATPAKPALKSVVKPLPAPPAKIGGTAAASVPLDLNKADIRTVEAELRRRGILDPK